MFAFLEHKLSRKGYTRKFREYLLSRAVKNIQVLERFLELIKSFYSEPEVSEILGSILFDEISRSNCICTDCIKSCKEEVEIPCRNEDITLKHYLASKIKSQNVQMYN